MATKEKYDRQLRLWGPHGQKALMEAHILLVGSSGVGSELLKNLVLPGIGKFTICDDRTVNDSDLGNNFFVELKDIGKPRAQVVTSWLHELNPDDVQANPAIVMKPADFVRERYDELRQYSVVIVSNQPPDVAMAFAAHCWSFGVPLVHVRSVGFLASLRLQLKGHDIIEGKPDPMSGGNLADLRLPSPFRELEEYADSVDMDRMDISEHKHVPYVVILLKAVLQWKRSHGGTRPTRADKYGIIDIIMAMSDSYIAPESSFKDDGAKSDWMKSKGFYHEDNFKEAVQFADSIWNSKSVNAEQIKQISESFAAAETSEFSSLVRALERFMEAHQGAIPHSGTVPDMISTTEQFLGLQKVYASKAASDKALMRAYTNELRGSHGLPAVSEDILTLFCKNAFNIERIAGRSMQEEKETPLMDGDLQMAHLQEPAKDPKQSPALWYLALEARNAFYQAKSRYPGQLLGNDLSVLQPDIDALWELMLSEARKFNVEEALVYADPPLLTKEHAQEIVRYGEVELHNISAIIAGIGAQEVVKIVTHQYIPLGNTYIFNGIASVGSRFSM